MARSGKLVAILFLLTFPPLFVSGFAFGDVTTSSNLESGLMFNLVKLPSLELKAQTGFQIGYKLFIYSESYLNKDQLSRPLRAGLMFRADYFSFSASSLLSDGNLYRGFYGYGLGLGAFIVLTPNSMTIFNVPIAFMADISAQIRVTEYTDTPLAGAQVCGTGSLGVQVAEIFKLKNRTFNLLIKLPVSYTTMAGATMVSTGLSIGFELRKVRHRNESAL